MFSNCCKFESEKFQFFRPIFQQNESTQLALQRVTLKAETLATSEIRDKKAQQDLEGVLTLIKLKIKCFLMSLYTHK